MAVSKSHVATFCLGVCVALSLFYMLSNQGVPIGLKKIKGQYQTDIDRTSDSVAVSTYRNTNNPKLSKTSINKSTIKKENEVMASRVSRIQKTDTLMNNNNNNNIKGQWVSPSAYSNMDGESIPGDLESSNGHSQLSSSELGGFSKTSVTERVLQTRVVVKPPGGINSHANLTQIKGDNQVVERDPEYTLVHNDRIRLIKDVCKDTELLRNSTYRANTAKIIFYSESYNFSYCKVPKSGCTFWTQLFLILHDYPKDSFGLKRASVHANNKLFAVPILKVIENKSRMVLVSRDPYSRLYSAFIDKSYLGLMPNLKTLIRGGLYDYYGCNFNVTFEEFLQYVIRTARYGRVLNRHWAPIFSLCSPCDVNQYRLVKQETFSKDVEFILKELNVEKDKYKTIIDGLHAHRIEATIPGIVDTVYTISRGQVNLKRCLGASGLAKRLWNSFKIQGYIDDRIEFPEDRFKSDLGYANANVLSDVVLETINKHPLSSIDSKRQRREALVSAYQSVSKVSIDGIKDVYKQDFALYGYDTKPPTIE